MMINASAHLFPRGNVHDGGGGIVATRQKVARIGGEGQRQDRAGVVCQKLYHLARRSVDDSNLIISAACCDQRPVGAPGNREDIGGVVLEHWKHVFRGNKVDDVNSPARCFRVLATRNNPRLCGGERRRQDVLGVVRQAWADLSACFNVNDRHCLIPVVAEAGRKASERKRKTEFEPCEYNSTSLRPYRDNRMSSLRLLPFLLASSQ